MQMIVQDVKYAFRQLRAHPGLFLAAVLTLALGLGANTAIFSLLDQALLRSLPVRDPQQLVFLRGTGDAWEGHTSLHGGDKYVAFSYPMYQDLRDQAKAFAGLIATAPADVGITRNGASLLTRAELVSGNYFAVLGVQPALGRVLAQADDTIAGANPVAVMSYEFWRSRFGADPSVVGATVAINGQPFQIIGISAPRFRSAVWGETPGVFVPMSMLDTIVPGKGNRLSNHKDRWLNILGRLQPGESAARAQVAVAPLWHALRSEELKQLGSSSQRFTAEYLTNSRLLVAPEARGFSYQREDYALPLIAMMAMAVMVLAMAVINVASLLLVRAAGRLREFTVRAAMGAGRWRLLQQLLTEGMLIGIAGGLGGLLLARYGTALLVRQWNGDQTQNAFSAETDARVLVLSFVLAVALSLLFSLAPALLLRRPDLTRAMRERSDTGSTSLAGFRRVTVCLQVMFSVLLLVGASLFVRTMQKLHSVDLGFNVQHLVTFGIDPKFAGYAPEAVPALHQRVLDAMRAVPGVQAAAGADQAVLDEGNTLNVTVAGYTGPQDEDVHVGNTFASPLYFATLQTPLLAGRAFTEGDRKGSPLVAVVNEAFARKFCGEARKCVGRLMATGAGDHLQLDTEIVGVVRDSKLGGIRSNIAPSLFRPLRQQGDPERLYVYLRTYMAPNAALETIRKTMQSVDPKLALTALRTMDAQIDDSLQNERMIALLAATFGVLAALLAGVGIYGVLAYATNQRTREIGIRLALGSSRTAVVRVVVADVALVAGLGAALALPVAYALSRLLREQLFGVSATDPLSVVIGVVLVGCVALLAAALPARRAAFVEPTQALRAE